MSWIVPENKLDAQQRDFVDNGDINHKNVWIKGFPGSGKSMLLAYTIKKIKRQSPNASIVVVVFTQSLITMFKSAFREMGMSVKVITYYEFMKSPSHYDYILSDEVQDLTPRVLREMNSRGQHIIVSGDENQSIYPEDPQYKEATVTSSQISSLINAREFELNIIHRLSKSIIGVVNKFLPNMNIFSAKPDMTKRSTQVRICAATSSSEEVRYIMREAKKAVNNGYTVGILLPTGKAILSFVNEALTTDGKTPWMTETNQWGKVDFSSLNRHLNNQGLPMQYVGSGAGEFSENNRKIAIMTYHSSKGLDFDYVFLPRLNRGLFISYNENLCKTLFMVAMTRSRGDLYLSYSGTKHEYLNKFSSDCNSIDIHSSLNGTGNSFGTGMFGDI